MAGGFGGDTVVVMPMWKRTTITAVQLLMTLLTAGVIIGYGQLYNMLVDKGVYHSKCDPGTDLTDVCADQATALSQLFEIGASLSIFVQAPSGVILDFLGPRITCWTGLFFFVPGCFLFAFAPNITSLDAYMFGFQLLATGGPLVFISTMPVSQLWPDQKALILMMVNGLYGGGAFVFFLISILYFDAGVSWEALFIGYGILGCMIVVVSFFAWPKRSWAEKSKRISLNQEAEDKPSPIELLRKSWRDIRTIHFAFIALLVSFLVFKSNFFLSTSNGQFAQLDILSDSQQTTYNFIFGVILPGMGILAGPIGLIFDKFGENFALVVLIVLSSISTICGMIVHNVSNELFGTLQIIRMVIFSFYYPVIYGVWAFFIMAKFGNTNFGVLYGVVAIFAGILNLAASNPTISFANNQPDFFTINLLLTCIGGVFIVYPILNLITQRLWRQKHGSGYYSIS